MREMTSKKLKYAKTWSEFIAKVEEQLEGEALCCVLNEEGYLPLKEYPNDNYIVKVKGYDVDMLGLQILKYKMKATKYNCILSVPNESGYYGFSHRGGVIVRLGDRIYDEYYCMDPKSEEAQQYIAEAKKTIEKDPSRANDKAEEIFMNFVPYRIHGFEVADTMEKVLQSAKNIADSLS